MDRDYKDIKIPEVKVDIPDYPNWRRGIRLGLICAIPAFGLAWLVPKADLQFTGTCAIIAYLAVGGLTAFKPPR